MRLAGRTRIEALLDEFDKEERPFAPGYDEDDPEQRIKMLVSLHRKSEELLKDYQSHLLYGYYSQIQQVQYVFTYCYFFTPTNHTFYIGFVFMDTETEENFEWVLNVSKKIFT